MKKPQINAIFPTCIYSNHLDTVKHNNTVEQVLDQYLFDRSAGIQGEYLGLADMQCNPALKDFYTDIADNIRIYTDVLGIRNELFDYHIVKSCISKHSLDQDVMARHTHNCSHISFVYYHQVPANSAVLMFHHDKHNNELFGGLFARERDRSMLTGNNPFNASEWYIEPEPGLLVVFPSKLVHSTRRLTDKMFSGDRIAIVGDVNMVLKSSEDDWETGIVSLDKWQAF